MVGSIGEVAARMGRLELVAEEEEALLRLLLEAEEADEGDDDDLSGAEARVEREIVRMIHSSPETLRANSGQAVAVGEQQVCVGYQDERGYRVWEWHGHLMIFDHLSSDYSPHYFYGNYFQRLPAAAAAAPPPRTAGLKELIHGSASGGGAAPPSSRVVHRCYASPLQPS